MPPVRRLGLSVTELRAGLTPGLPVAEALARTWLAATPEPWTVQSHVTYDITHTVYHLTRWGGALDGLPADVADYLTRWLPTWLDDWATLEHWDLFGELLVVGAYLPRVPPPVRRRLPGVLPRRGHRRAGGVPRLPPGGTAHVALATCRHTHRTSLVPMAYTLLTGDAFDRP